MSVWFIALMEKVVIACCEKTKKIRQWAWRHKCCTLLIAWPIVVNWDIWLAYTATPIRCAMMGDDRMQVFVTKEEWQQRYPHPLQVPEGEDDWVWVKDNNLDDETKNKYSKEMEYKGYIYELDYISRKYPHLTKYSYDDDKSNYFKNHTILYYDYAQNELVGVAYIIRGWYKIPIYDGYHSMGCDLTKHWDDELASYIRTY